MIEKQDASLQDPNWKAEKEKNKALSSPPPLVADSSWERKKEREKERVVAKMIHIEVERDDGEEISCVDDIPSSKWTTEEASEYPESRLSNTSRFVVELAESPERDPRRKTYPAHHSCAENDMVPDPDWVKEQQPNRHRKKRRPQSLNLGMSTEFIYEKEGDGSNEGDEESNEEKSSPEKIKRPVHHSERKPAAMDQEELSPLKDDQRATMTEQNLASLYGDPRLDHSPSDGEARETSPQEEVRPSTGSYTKSPASESQPASQGLGPVNGPGKAEHDSLPAQFKDESQVRQRGTADSRDNPVLLRQVRTHERKASSSGGEDIEGLTSDKVQRRSFQRLSGSSQSEITRIVPLKPERSKSVTCKDEKDRGSQETECESFKERILRREYRWSMGSSEGSDWTEVPTFQPMFNPPTSSSVATSASPGSQVYSQTSTNRDMPQRADEWGLVDPVGSGIAESVQSQSRPACDDACQAAMGPMESHLLSCKASALSKTGPPAPPVKTQKARESGLILRNSRNVSREPGLDAAKKRHSVTLLGICFSVIGSKASHELQTDSHTHFTFFIF